MTIVGGLRIARAVVEDAKRAVELDIAATHHSKLRNGVIVRAGLADLPAVERGDLIRADDERNASAVAGQALRRLLGRFAIERRFVDVGRHDIERNAQQPR